MYTPSLMFVLALALSGPGQQAASARITIDSVLLKVTDEAVVSPRESGLLAAIHVTEGQAVEQGQVLAQLEDTEARILRNRTDAERRLARKQVENDVDVRFAQKKLEVAQAELRRAKESIERYKKSVSESEMDRLRLAEQQAALELELARHELQVAALSVEIKESDFLLAEEKVHRCQIVAPISGVVAEIKRHRGEWVEPKQPLLRIVRVDRLRAECLLNGKAVTNDLVGAAVTLTADVGGKRQDFPGRLAFVSPELDSVNGQCRVWAEIENRGLLLRPGMQAAMVIHRP
jgi:macrolide-specific efflux system membrane fusion protein